MDADRFDALARSLIGPRRAALRALAGAALGVVLAAPGWLAGAAEPRGRGKERAGEDHGRDVGRPAAAGQRRRPAATCRVEQRPYDVMTTFATKLKRQKLSLTTIDITPRNPQDDHTNTTTIKRGRAVLVRIEETRAPSGQLTYRTTYGAGFAGIDEIVLVVNGGTIGGEVDGRALVPFPASNIPDTFAFQDGQPAPELRASEATKTQIKQMLDRAAAEPPGECAPAPSRQAGDGRERRDGRIHAQGGNEAACLACKGRVFWQSRLCESDVYGYCSPLFYSFFFALGYAGCMAGGVYACNYLREEDLRLCRESPNCCPVRCGDLPDDSCCFGGRTCLTPHSNFGVCCEVGSTPCHERTCCPPGATCRPDGLCCPRGTQVCGDANCCPNDRSCCGSTNCCAADESCQPDGTCCRTRNLCGGVCCRTTCCNNVCCRDTQSCQNGQCVAICDPNFHLFPCPDEPGNPTCCSALWTCCQNGQCCGPGQKCCPLGHGAFGCRALTHSCGIN